MVSSSDYHDSHNVIFCGDTGDHCSRCKCEADELILVCGDEPSLSSYRKLQDGWLAKAIDGALVSIAFYDPMHRDDYKLEKRLHGALRKMMKDRFKQVTGMKL